MRNRHIVFCALALIACGCNSSSKPQPAFVFEQRIGVVKWRATNGCLAVFNPSVAPQTKVALIDQPTSTNPPTVAEASVVERVPAACDEGVDNANDAGV